MLSIGILSHNSPITLKNTLSSYKHFGLLNFTDDIFCVLQPSEKVNEEIHVCDNFGVKYFLENTNTWMQGGIRRVFNESKYEIVLFTENDFRIHTNINIENILISSVNWLRNSVVDLIRIRNLKNPGHPLQLPLSLYNDIVDGSFNRINEYTTNIHYWTHYLENPEKILSNYIKKINDNPKLFLMSSKHCGYTNNCYITTKNFFYDNLSSYATAENPHFEPSVDKIWHQNDFKIGITDGFLTHVRMDGHNNCWCCHTNCGGTSNQTKCQCCYGNYIDDLSFKIDENGIDISKYLNGVDKLKKMHNDIR